MSSPESYNSLFAIFDASIHESKKENPKEKEPEELPNQNCCFYTNPDSEAGEQDENWFSAGHSIVGATKQEVNAPCAKWCKVLKDGRCTWNHSKLKCLLSQDEHNDVLLVRNLIHGMIFSSQLHPLIFERSSEQDDEVVWLRSLPFFEQLVADMKSGRERYRSLDEKQKQIIAIGVRDLFLGGWYGLLNERETFLLENMVEILEHPLETAEAAGMQLSFHPSSCFKVVKVIENLDDSVGPEWSSYFAQVMHTPRLFAVFVDPAELSYHNMENIVPLDRWLECRVGDQEESGSLFSMTNLNIIKEGREVLACKLQGPGCTLLQELSTLDLYVTPLNKATRGGQRFIFHSALFSSALSHALRESDLLDQLSYGQSRESFEFVNYVFRCNRFAPRDENFGSHLDSPYYDEAESLVSKYTLLIYLTGGHSEPALRVEDVTMDEIDEMTCIIFDQSYEHEGKPFTDNEKIFLRSELVFRDTKLGRDDRIAPLFSQACYLTGQGAFDKEVASYAHECFERANSLHWAIEREATQPPLYLLKEFQNIQFLTNGFDYWFVKGGGMTPADCAIIAVLDYFNCKVNSQPFHSLCRSETIRTKIDRSSEVWAAFGEHRDTKVGRIKRLEKSDVDFWTKGCSKNYSMRYNEIDWNEKRDCCWYHTKMVREFLFGGLESTFLNCHDFIRQKICAAPILLFNQELFINESSIDITSDKIFILRESKGEPLPAVNFAAIENIYGGREAEFIDIAHEVDAPKFLIPPISWHEFEPGYQLVLDFFRNDWMVKVDGGHRIPVPIIPHDRMPDRYGNNLDSDEEFSAEETPFAYKLSEEERYYLRL